MHLKKHSGLNGIYPISVMSSSSTTKYHVEMNLVKEIIEFLSNQFEYRESDTDVVFDVCDREIDKYIAECVNDIMMHTRQIIAIIDSHNRQIFVAGI